MSIGIVVEAIVLNFVWAFELKVYPFFIFMDVSVGPLGFMCVCRLATPQETSQLSAEQLAESSVFVVKGVARGTAILLFNSTSTSGHVITSWPVEIQVTYT